MTSNKQRPICSWLYGETNKWVFLLRAEDIASGQPCSIYPLGAYLVRPESELDESHHPMWVQELLEIPPRFRVEYHPNPSPTDKTRQDVSLYLGDRYYTSFYACVETAERFSGLVNGKPL